MSEAEVTQVYGEALVESDGGVRVGQVFVEAMVDAASAATATGVYAEVVRSVADRPATAVTGVVVCIVAG